MNDFHSLLDATDGHGQVAKLYGHPDDVLASAHLTLEEKRALLASWASDANVGSEQEQCEIVRSLYQPTTAIADLMTIPPSGLRRI